jgi:hypothetical protein
MCACVSVDPHYRSPLTTRLHVFFFSSDPSPDSSTGIGVARFQPKMPTFAETTHSVVSPFHDDMCNNKIFLPSGGDDCPPGGIPTVLLFEAPVLIIYHSGIARLISLGFRDTSCYILFILEEEEGDDDEEKENDTHRRTVYVFSKIECLV